MFRFWTKSNLVSIGDYKAWWSRSVHFSRANHHTPQESQIVSLWIKLHLVRRSWHRWVIVQKNLVKLWGWEERTFHWLKTEKFSHQGQIVNIHTSFVCIGSWTDESVLSIKHCPWFSGCTAAGVRTTFDHSGVEKMAWDGWKENTWEWVREHWDTFQKKQNYTDNEKPTHRQSETGRGATLTHGGISFRNASLHFIYTVENLFCAHSVLDGPGIVPRISFQKLTRKAQNLLHRRNPVGKSKNIRKKRLRLHFAHVVRGGR